MIKVFTKNIILLLSITFPNSSRNHKFKCEFIYLIFFKLFNTFKEYKRQSVMAQAFTLIFSGGRGQQIPMTATATQENPALKDKKEKEEKKKNQNKEIPEDFMT